jgi:hypothetical protein
MKKIRLALAALVVTAVGLPLRSARAEEQFDLVAGKGEITVVAKGHWHVNKDYPWRVVIGDKTLDKSHFALTETSAKITGVPAGTVKLKGAVCEGAQCMPFVKDVAVQ